MNISVKGLSVFTQGMGRGLKSTQQKLERQQKMQSQVDFFEGRKADLKNMKCETLEEIEQKLELFNNYDAQIMAAKQQYNQEQMMHTLDEAEERGKEIAKAAEKQKPKTAEERKREKIEEALGTEEEGGMLTELLDESMEELSELQEQITEEQLAEEQLAEEILAEELLEEEQSAEDLASADSVRVISEAAQQQELTEEPLKGNYTPINIRA